MFKSLWHFVLGRSTVRQRSYFFAMISITFPSGPALWVDTKNVSFAMCESVIMLPWHMQLSRIQKLRVLYKSQFMVIMFISVLLGSDYPAAAVGTQDITQTFKRIIFFIIIQYNCDD